MALKVGPAASSNGEGAPPRSLQPPTTAATHDAKDGFGDGRVLCWENEAQRRSVWKEIEEVETLRRKDAFPDLDTYAAIKLKRNEYMGPTMESNWVLPGKLLVGAYPASMDDGHHAQLLCTILLQGVGTFVCLQQEYRSEGVTEAMWREGGALRPYFPDALELLRRLHAARRKDPALAPGIAVPDSARFVHFPIVDCNVADDVQVLLLATRLALRVAQGEVLYLHCWGGHGRTGTVVSIMLHIMYGLTAEEAMGRCQTVHDIRRIPIDVPSPQTPAQRQQVHRVVLSIVRWRQEAAAAAAAAAATSALPSPAPPLATADEPERPQALPPLELACHGGMVEEEEEEGLGCSGSGGAGGVVVEGSGGGDNSPSSLSSSSSFVSAGTTDAASMEREESDLDLVDCGGGGGREEEGEEGVRTEGGGMAGGGGGAGAGTVALRVSGEEAEDGMDVVVVVPAGHETAETETAKKVEASEADIEMAPGWGGGGGFWRPLAPPAAPQTSCSSPPPPPPTIADEEDDTEGEEEEEAGGAAAAAAAAAEGPPGKRVRLRHRRNSFNTGEASRPYTSPEGPRYARLRRRSSSGPVRPLAERPPQQQEVDSAAAAAAEGAVASTAATVWGGGVHHGHGGGAGGEGGSREGEKGEHGSACVGRRSSPARRCRAQGPQGASSASPPPPPLHVVGAGEGEG